MKVTLEGNISVLEYMLLAVAYLNRKNTPVSIKHIRMTVGQFNHSTPVRIEAVTSQSFNNINPEVDILFAQKGTDKKGKDSSFIMKNGLKNIGTLSLITMDKNASPVITERGLHILKDVETISADIKSVSIQLLNVLARIFAVEKVKLNTNEPNQKLLDVPGAHAFMMPIHATSEVPPPTVDISKISEVDRVLMTLAMLATCELYMDRSLVIFLISRCQVTKMYLRDMSLQMMFNTEWRDAKTEKYITPIIQSTTELGYNFVLTHSDKRAVIQPRLDERLLDTCLRYDIFIDLIQKLNVRKENIPYIISIMFPVKDR